MLRCFHLASTITGLGLQCRARWVHCSLFCLCGLLRTINRVHCPAAHNEPGHQTRPSKDSLLAVLRNIPFYCLRSSSASLNLYIKHTSTRVIYSTDFNLELFPATSAPSTLGNRARDQKHDIIISPYSRIHVRFPIRRVNNPR